MLVAPQEVLSLELAVVGPVGVVVLAAVAGGNASKGKTLHPHPCC